MPAGSKPGARRGGRQKGTGNKQPWPKPSLRMIAKACEVDASEAAEEFDALAAMKALARQLMTRVTGEGKQPTTPEQRVLYEMRLGHLVPLLKEIATYQQRKKGPEPAPVDDGREAFLEVLALMVAKHVHSDSAKREIFEVLEAEVRRDVPRLVPPIRSG